MKFITTNVYAESLLDEKGACAEWQQSSSSSATVTLVFFLFTCILIIVIVIIIIVVVVIIIVTHSISATLAVKSYCCQLIETFGCFPLTCSQIHPFLLSSV